MKRSVYQTSAAVTALALACAFSPAAFAQTEGRIADDPNTDVILLYLEGVDAASIGEITGLSARNVSTKIHRIKQVLARRFHEGPSHGR